MIDPLAPPPSLPPSWVVDAIRAAPVGVVVTSRNGDHIFVNPYWCEMTGLASDRALGRGWLEAIHGADRERVEANWYKEAPAGRVIEARCRVQRPDGVVRWVQGFAVPIYTPAQELIGHVGILVDVTDRHGAERAYRTLLENSLQGMIVLQEGRPVFANRALSDILGRSREAMLASTTTQALSIVHDDDRERVRTTVVAFIAGETDAARFDTRIIRPDGAVRAIEALMSRIDYRGRPALQIAYMDVTERRQIEERLQSLNADLERRVRERTAQLEATVRELESFSYSVSHDLRAPLRAIDGFSQALLEDYGATLDERAHGYLGRVRHAAGHMGELIDDLLTLSRVIRSEFDRAAVDVSALAAEIAEAMQRAAPQRVVTLRIAPGLRASGDRVLLRTVLDNLLGNAWKFTAGRADACIELGAVPGGQPPVFFVRDNGVGFDMAYVDKLFRPFQRLHAPDEFEGTGIGLATVHRIIARHGGRVWAESQPGQGATFYFTLAAD